MSASSPTDPETRRGGVTIGDVQGGIHDSIIVGGDLTVIQRITNWVLGDSEQQRALRNRQAMLQLVRNTWIKGVLEQSLHGAAMIELGMEERADAVERPWDMVVQMPGQPNRQLPKGTRIIQVFDEMNQSLLILGEPGSGKTTMLLDLARDSIDRAEQDPTQPIPVVFNLSSWAAKKRSISAWLIDELNSKYNVPQKIARPWVENDQLLLLLDGLDEVKVDSRRECVNALNDFRSGHLVPMAVCSRVADYEALTNRLNLCVAVLLQPLTAEQIDQYLAGTGAELLAVRTVLECDSDLRELAQTPVLLSIMTLAYRGLPSLSAGDASSVEATRHHLFAAYVQSMFQRRSVDRRHSPRKTVRWLSWLARKMIEQAQTVLLIERMQPDWLDTRGQRRIYGVGTVLSTMLLFVLAFGLSYGLLLVLVFMRVGEVPEELISAVGAALVAVLWIGLWFSLVMPLGYSLLNVQSHTQLFGRLVGKLGVSLTYYQAGRIETVDALRWSWRKALEGLVVGLLVGLAVGLLGALNVGLSAGLVGGLAVGLGVALVYAIQAELVEPTATPNQGITRSARNGAIVGLAGGSTVGLAFGLVFGPGYSVNYGLVLGLAVGLIYGGYTVLKHTVLRTLLIRAGHMPWRYARFLDYATERIFLRKVGGGYIFVHRLLMEYFASLTEADIADLTKAI